MSTREPVGDWPAQLLSHPLDPKEAELVAEAVARLPVAAALVRSLLLQSDEPGVAAGFGSPGNG